VTADKFKIHASDSLLLIIDFQSSLAAAMDKKVYEQTERNLGLMIATCTKLDVPILVTEQYSKGLGTTMERIRARLAKAYRPIEKVEFSCYSNAGFRSAFKKVERQHLLLAGIETHVCVLQSALDLVSTGHTVHLLSDATCSRYKNDWKNGLKFMRQAGAVVTTTEIASFQLLQRAGTPEFKAMSPLFKDKEDFWSL
jgi:nicotinamidase-related amidase